MIKKFIYSDKGIRLICVFVLFFNCILLSKVLKIYTYIYDSSYYWTVADEVYSNNHLDILQFPETYRGCLFPLGLLFMKIIFRGAWGWRLMSAMMVSLIFGVFLPKILRFRIATIIDVIRIVLSELVFFYIWGDFLQYPLSDLPAFFFFAAGTYFSVHVTEGFQEERNSNGDRVKSIIIGLAMGACLYTAYNCRAAYMYGGAVIVIIVIFLAFKHKRKAFLLSVLIAALVGVGIVSYPQCIINRKYVGVYSPKVYTEQFHGYGSSLQFSAAVYGIKISRYDTYDDYVADEYPGGGIVCTDPIGETIVSEEDAATGAFTTLFRRFIKYPLDMIGIYTRHLISLITPAWNQIYITRFHTNKNILFLLSLVLWYVLGISLIAQMKKKGIHCKDALFVIPILIPPLLQMVGLPELRVFLPVHVLLYAYVFSKTDYVTTIRYIRSNWKTILLISLFIAILWVTVYGDTLAMNEVMPILINDSRV